MKNPFPFISVVVITGLIVSCSQHEQLLNNQLLVSSKTSSIKRGEPVRFSFNEEDTISPVQWKVVPDESTSIIDSGKTAIITFNMAGNYLVSGSNENTTQTAHVTVDTATAQKVIDPDSVSRIISLVGETLILTPISWDSLPYPGLVIESATSSNFKCRSFIISSQNISTDTLKIEFTGVESYFDCTPLENNKAKGVSYFYPYEDKGIKPGDYSIKIKSGGVTYYGNLHFNGTTFQITWPYNTGIIFSKLTVTK